MDINSVIVLLSICAMSAAISYSANIWYRYFHQKPH